MIIHDVQVFLVLEDVHFLGTLKSCFLQSFVSMLLSLQIQLSCAVFLNILLIIVGKSAWQMNSLEPSTISLVLRRMDFPERKSNIF